MIDFDDTLSAAQHHAPQTRDQLRDMYEQDAREWFAEDKRNRERWARMSNADKLRIASTWRDGKGLYTFESCVRGLPELTFPPHKSIFDE